MPKLFYGNFLFDVSLGNARVTHLARSVAEMGPLLIPLASSGDRIVLDCLLPDTYGEYLSSTGLSCPGPFVPGDAPVSLTGVAWGWDEDAVNRLSRSGVDCVHPDLSIVKMVNGRRFCFEVNRKTASGVPGASICRSVKEIEHVLRNASQFPQVIKPEHGNSGHGFIRKTTPELTAAECIEIETSIQGSGSVIVEPWLNRVADVSTRCMIGPDGSVSALQHYRTCVNRVGAFDALWIDDDDPVTAAWHEYLDEKVSVCARTLAGAGYFGPAAFDSFIWREANGTEQCAAVIEINARYSMSWIAFALHERFAQNRVSLLHFLTKKQCRLPDTYALLSGQLGKDAYNPSTREGAILVTPLRVGFTASSLQQPGRNVFFIVARDSRQLFERDAMIRNRFAPKKK